LAAAEHAQKKKMNMEETRMMWGENKSSGAQENFEPIKGAGKTQQKGEQLELSHCISWKSRNWRKMLKGI